MKIKDCGEWIDGVKDVGREECMFSESWVMGDLGWTKLTADIKEGIVVGVWSHDQRRTRDWETK